METWWLLGFTCSQTHHRLAPLFPLCKFSSSSIVNCQHMSLPSWKNRARPKMMMTMMMMVTNKARGAGFWVFQLYLPPPFTESEWVMRWRQDLLSSAAETTSRDWSLDSAFLFLFLDIGTLWKRHLTRLWPQRRLDVKKRLSVIHPSTSPLNCQRWSICFASEGPVAPSVGGASNWSPSKDEWLVLVDLFLSPLWQSGKTFN